MSDLSDEIDSSDRSEDPDGRVVMKESDGLSFYYRLLEANTQDDDRVVTNVTTKDKLVNMFLGCVPFDCPETISRELKQFWIFTSIKIPLSNSNIREMFESNDFGRLIPYANNRLREMIVGYVPKYFCTFINTEVTECELIFGLSDDGEVTGVLLDSSVTESDIFDMVWDVVEKCIRLQDEHLDYYLKEIRESISVNMIELSTDPNDIAIPDWSQQYLDRHQRKIDRYNEIRSKHLRQMRHFTRKMRYYRRGINELVNDRRVHPELIKFVTTYPNVDVDIKDDIIKYITYLMENNDIDITFSSDDIATQKHHPDNLVYWIAKYRDVMSDRIVRPRGPMNLKPPKLYKSLLLRNPVSRIAGGFHNDARAKMVVIQIILPGYYGIRFPFADTSDLNGKTNHRMTYHRSFSYVGKNGEIHSPTRVLCGNGPSCV